MGSWAPVSWAALGGLVCLVWGPGCVPTRGGWDVSALPPEARSQVSRVGGRLSDLLPQPLPDGKRLSLFLCRWPTTRPISVGLPADVTARERQLFRKALAAWESAGLGISFQEVESSAARLEIEFPTPAQGQPAGTGDALADCRIRDPEPASGVVEAQLVRASIHLVRDLPNWKGQRVTLTDDEQFAAMLHELGHALGFAGHVASGDSILLADTAKVRQIARRVAQGEPLPAPELVALYALPSGMRVGQLPLDASQQKLFEAFNRVAQAEGLRGPFSRVGDRQARFFYRDDDGRAQGITLENWSQWLHRGGSLRMVPDYGVRRVLDAGRPGE
ncbi:MAG: matrixin family metalloprotease [Myxococcota bacterium]